MAVTLPSPPRADKRGSTPPVEPLENGDLLTAGEFLRRDEAMPHVKKAELIEGIVYLGSPVRLIHAEPDTLAQTWLGFYAAHTPGTEAAGHATCGLMWTTCLSPMRCCGSCPNVAGARASMRKVISPGRPNSSSKSRPAALRLICGQAPGLSSEWRARVSGLADGGEPVRLVRA